MIFLKRKRLIIWLIRAYLKRWGRVILISFLLGFGIFALLYLNRHHLFSVIPTGTETVGIAGDYPVEEFPNNLPEEIISKTSRGLTKVDSNGVVKPDIAKRWEVKDDGKTYIFYLNNNLTFSNGKPVDSSTINYNFADVKIEKPAKSVIVFKLKDRYSPFLVTVANRKVLDKNLVGVASYKIKDVQEKDGFVRSIELESRTDRRKIKYYFYPTQAALKDAYVLGDVSRIIDINNLSYNNQTDFTKFKNTDISKQINNNKIATVFINNTDSVLSDKKVRKALAYSLPDKFSEGERAYSPYRKDSWAYNPDVAYKKDIEYAKEQLEGSNASSSGKIKINLKTLRPYRLVAEDLAKSWKAIGIETKVEVVEGVPNDYQAFLGELPVLKDPDQYTLWHTGQPNNITNYRNLRIDKLLEDGRRTTDQEERKTIYNDFQKYLVDDMPAIFLYFPYTYTLNRK
jgi:peptide/nickel transport system substrate-binding protein